MKALMRRIIRLERQGTVGGLHGQGLASLLREAAGWECSEESLWSEGEMPASGLARLLYDQPQASGRADTSGKNP